MASQIYELAILLSLKDLASGGLNRTEAHLRSLGKEGRATLQTFQDLRRDLKQNLAVAGVGVGILTMMKKGVDVAGDFEAAMADMRMSIEELGDDGAINVNKLTGEYNKLESLGIRVGNRLPGTTRDFIEMFSTLKQGGLQASTIIDGAGESVANLAVVTNEVPRDLAEPFAQYAQQFKLTGDEAIKLSDVLARIRFATGLRPGELIEGSKFFQLRAGLPLGFTGLQGADLSGRLLATLRSYGLEGGIGGRELGGFMLSLNFNTKEKQKMIAELKSTKGIDLKFFDNKGAFLGVDNVFTQMEKLRKLSTQDQMKFGEKLFDREGMAIASVFMKSGLDGWREINQRINKVPPLQELINQKTETYNAKLEAVKGTLTNLEAATFTPLLDQLKPIADATNQWAGSLQEVGKSHPAMASVTTDILGLTGVALTLAGGVRAVTTAWGLYSIASKAARVQLTGAAAEAGMLNRTVNSLAGMKTLRLTVQFIVAGVAIEQILKWKSEYDEQQKQFAEKNASLADSYDEAMRGRQLYQRSGQGDRGVYEQLALKTLDTLKMGRGLEMDLEPDRAGFFEHFWTSQRPYASRWGMQTADNFTRPFSPDIFAQTLRGSEAVKPLQDPNVLARFLQQSRVNMQLSPEAFDLFKQGVEKAMAGVTTQSGQPVYTEALKILNDELMQVSTNAENVNRNLADWFRTATPLAPAFERATRAVNSFSNILNNYQPPTIGGSQPNITPVTPPNLQFDRPFSFPKTSFSPRVSSSVTPAAAFTPAAARAILPERSGTIASAEGRDVHHHHGSRTVHLHVHGVNDPTQIADMVAYQLEIQSERA